jgi:all-trans-8'-apo-beta-carotenal 15,15'-oxygenase
LRTRFVRTRKFEAEDAAGCFLYPTWTTPAPRHLDNLPGYPRQSQAGVSPVVRHGKLYAFDEVGLPYALAPDTLATLGPADPYDGPKGSGPSDYKAHSKIDGESGGWILAASRGRLKTALHVLVKDRDGRQIAHAACPSPRGRAYFHDFFWAGGYAVFHLQPALLESAMPLFLGIRPYTDCLSWRPDEGSLLHVLDTAGRRPSVTV